jgi:hypothetical protein
MKQNQFNKLGKGRPRPIFGKRGFKNQCSLLSTPRKNKKKKTKADFGLDFGGHFCELQGSCSKVYFFRMYFNLA